MPSTLTDMMQAFNLLDIEQFFKDSLSAIKHPIEDIKFNTTSWQRFNCPESSSNNKAASYKGHSDGVPVLKFECHKCGIKTSFCFNKGRRKLSFEELQKSQELIAKKKTENTLKEQKSREQALHNLKIEWNAAQQCVTHPYFTRKKIQVFKSDGLRVNKKNELLCPLRSINGNLVSLQRIYAEESKSKFKPFFRGTSPKACFHILPAQGDGGCYSFLSALKGFDTFILSESIGTGLTLREALQQPIIICYGKNNFESVSRSIRKNHPSAKIIFCCDRDADSGSEKYAKIAIASLGVNCAYVLPDFSILNLTPEQLIDAKATDFNDLFCELIKKGIKRDDAFMRVRTQIII